MLKNTTKGAGGEIDILAVKKFTLDEILSEQINLILSILVGISLAFFLSVLVNDISLKPAMWLFQMIILTLITIVFILFLISETKLKNQSIFSKLCNYFIAVAIFLLPYSIQRYNKIPAEWPLSFLGIHGIIISLLLIIWGGWDLRLIKKKKKQQPPYSADIIKIIMGVIFLIISVWVCLK